MQTELIDFKEMLRVTREGEVIGDYWKGMRVANERLQQEREKRKELEAQQRPVEKKPKTRKPKAKAKAYIPRKRRTFAQILAEDGDAIVKQFLELKYAPSTIATYRKQSTKTVYKILTARGIDYELEMAARRDEIVLSEKWVKQATDNTNWEEIIPNIEKKLEEGKTLIEISEEYNISRRQIAQQVLKTRRELENATESPKMQSL